MHKNWKVMLQFIRTENRTELKLWTWTGLELKQIYDNWIEIRSKKKKNWTRTEINLREMNIQTWNERNIRTKSMKFRTKNFHIMRLILKEVEDIFLAIN